MTKDRPFVSQSVNSEEGTMEFTDVKNRYSCKKYSGRTVEDEKLAAIRGWARGANREEPGREQHVYVLQSADALREV